MAHTTKQNASNYAGFLNGYIAGNLAANSQELHFHSDKIYHFIKELKNEIVKWELQPDDRKKVDELFEAFTSISAADNKIDSYIVLGNAIYELLSYLQSCKPEMPSTTSFILKKIIYHYLNIAKNSKNRAVTIKAKKIAEKFES
jgi:hypothetical protein